VTGEKHPADDAVDLLYRLFHAADIVDESGNPGVARWMQ
jgi:hypothetical protein